MASATELLRLDERVALHVVQAALQRAWSQVTTFEYSSGSIDHVLACDSLVFDRFTKPPGNVALALNSQAPGATDREAVALCYAVSCCGGYSFQENRHFWQQALALDASSTSVAVLNIGRIANEFPPVVVCLQGIFDDGLNRYLDGFFDLASPLAVKSREFGLAMATLKVYMLPERMAQPIHINLDIVSLRSWGLATMPSTLQRISTDTSAATVGDNGVIRFDLREVRFHHLNWNYRTGEAMFKAVPPGVEVRMAGSTVFPTIVTSTGLDPSRAWKLMAGCEWTGHLRKLDMSGEDVDVRLSALCSLLPHSPSIEALSVSTKTLADWLWLGYAMFHPQACSTRWNTLKITATEAPPAAFDLLDACFRANTWPMAAVEVISQGQNSTIETFHDRLDQSRRVVQLATTQGTSATLSIPMGFAADVCSFCRGSVSRYLVGVHHRQRVA